uniref:Uncharacterized protein n=1 Tax=Anguilla anguilla TaxID=7936 RepID=A0A0E9S0T3_ANGAN
MRTYSQSVLHRVIEGKASRSSDVYYGGSCLVNCR